MNVLTIKQPSASLIFRVIKDLNLEVGIQITEVNY